jgi:uncharacterized membrane protein
MYALHPATVHFPIGLLLASSLFTLIATRRQDGTWGTSAYHCLLVGWIAGVAALLTGTIEAYRHLTGPETARSTTLINWVNLHGFSAVAAMLVYGNALLQHRRHRNILNDPLRRSGYVRLHMIGALLIIIGGWVGGYLVYQLGLGVAPA